MQLLLRNGNFIFEGTYDEKDVPKAAGLRWHSIVPKFWATSDPRIAARLIDVVDMAPEVREAIDSGIAEKTVTAELSRATEADILIPAPEGLEYRPFQRAGIQFTATHNNTLIADEMGLGKTIQAIGTINLDPAITSAIIICPASLRINWKRELEAWLTRPMTIGIAQGNDLPIDADILIINYDILDRHIEALAARTFNIAIVDESHYIKNQKTKRYKAVKAIVSNTERKVFLTGTPIPNRPKEGFAIFNLLDSQAFNNYWRYAAKFCNGHKNRFGYDDTGSSNLGELQTILRESFMIRRLKKDVLTELPSKVRQVITLPTNGLANMVKAEQKKVKEWEDALKAAQSRIDSLAENKDSAEYGKAVQALNSLVKVAFTEMSQVRHETSLAKVPYVADHIKEMMNELDKVVVFSHHRDVADALEEALADFGPVKHIGGINDTKRDANVQAFQNDPSVRVFIGNIQAAGVGITLTAASTVVFAEMDWVPSNMTQAEDRLHRMGQNDSVLVQHVVVDGSLDAKMAAILVAKQKVIDQALDDEPQALDDSAVMGAIFGAKEQAIKATAKREADAVLTADMTDENVADIHAVLRVLADLCDGAHATDGTGYNRMDTAFGKQLAAQSSITKRQALAGKKMAHKYQGQLPADLAQKVFG